MSHRLRAAFPAFLLSISVGVALSPRPAEAGASASVLALAAPLASQFGVPASAVTSLLESGISLESATQLLLVSQSSKAKLDDVTGLYRSSGNDIAKTAAKLEVDPSAYSQQKVTAAIDQAKSAAAADAKQKAADGANEALGDALGGLRR